MNAVPVTVEYTHTPPAALHRARTRAASVVLVGVEFLPGWSRASQLCCFAVAALMHAPPSARSAKSSVGQSHVARPPHRCGSRKRRSAAVHAAQLYAELANR